MHNSRVKTSGITIRDEQFLPDDLLIEIASRLSIEDALKFRLVCKRIRDLIMSPHFMNLFKLKSSIAPMLLQTSPIPGCEQYLLKIFWNSGCTKSEIPKTSAQLYHEYAMEFSHNGLIVSKSCKNPGEFIVFNPIYGQNVKISVPSIPESEILGVFYQDALKEYSTLWQFTVSSRPVNVRFKMLNLGAEPKWKEITNPWSQNGRFQDIQPVSVNEYLYWVSGYTNSITMYEVDVMEFDTKTETFEVIRCPVTVSFFFGKCNVNLLQANGLLVLAQLEKKCVNIWTLKDRVNKAWMHSERVKVYLRIGLMSKAVAYWNGEIRGILVCKSSLASLQRSRKIGNGECHSTKSFVSHVTSLASLENCKSEICMVPKAP